MESKKVYVYLDHFGIKVFGSVRALTNTETLMEGEKELNYRSISQKLLNSLKTHKKRQYNSKYWKIVETEIIRSKKP